MNKDEDFGAMLEEFEGKAKATSPAGRGPQIGDVVRGRVLTVGREIVFLTLADGKTEAVLDLEELRDENGQLSVKEGDQIEARVAELGDKAGHVVLRRMVRRGPEARAELQQAFELGIPVEGTVSAVNKGGVEVNVAGVRGFCPISQLDARQVEDASSFVGKKLTFKVTRHELDRRGVNLVLSRRALLEEEARERAVGTRQKLIVGAVLPGTVTAIKDFGAFVDLGGIEGMLPASELSFTRGVRPGEVLSVGQQLEVKVLRIERTDDQLGTLEGFRTSRAPAPAGEARLRQRDPRRSERISLSLKSLAQDPWEEVPARFPAGSKVTGKIVRLEAFGAFVELAPGIEGLLHIGQLASQKDGGAGGHLRHARDAAKVGDTKEMTVLSIDRERRRISLGLGDNLDEIDPEGLAAARAANPGKLGTLGDLLKHRKK
jgi:small subunit ribosomal protein S1